MTHPVEPKVAECVRGSRWPRLATIAMLIALLCVPAADLLARGGGVRWQSSYSQFPEPFFQLWTFASPWSGLSGFSIPHHNLHPPGYEGGYGPSGPLINPGAYPQMDRSVEFPGSSSNLSTTVRVPQNTDPNRPARTGKEFDPPYFRNYDSYWHKGYWGGGQWGWANWGGIPGAGAFPRWSLGPIYYASGYGDYRNPFLGEVAGKLPPFIDYSKPIDDIADDEEPPSPSTSTSDEPAGPSEETPEEALKYLVRSPEVKAGMAAFDAAARAFRDKDYHTALDKTHAALEHLPHDPALHEFRGLVLFAQGEYAQAAATIYAVLALSPGWNWATLSGLYGDQEEFTRQIRALEAYRKQHPKSAAAAFVLAWHYTTCRHTAAAAKLFQTVAELLPDDALTPPLALLVAGAGETQAAATGPSKTPATPVSSATIVNRQRGRAAVDPAKIVGIWKATHDSTSIQLDLRDNGSFVWRATSSGRSRQFAGRYAVGGDLLMLAAGHGTLAGTVRLREKGGFNFLAGETEAGDKGLDFTAAASR